MTAISNRTPPVTVEYDYRGQRVQKTFDDAFAAKRFYVSPSVADNRSDQGVA